MKQEICFLLRGHKAERSVCAIGGTRIFDQSLPAAFDESTFVAERFFDLAFLFDDKGIHKI